MSDTLRGAVDRAEHERREFQIISTYDDPVYFEDYLSKYGPHSEFAPVARRRIEDLLRQRHQEALQRHRDERFFGIPLHGFGKLQLLASAIGAVIAVVIAALGLFQVLTGAPPVSDMAGASPMTGTAVSGAVATPLVSEVITAPAAPTAVTVVAPVMAEATATSGRPLYDTSTIEAAPADSFAVAPGQSKSPKPLVIVE